MELMRVTEDRNPSVSGLISHLQTVAEREKAGIARELHDELGGLLVAASMDLAWLEREIRAAAESPRSGEVHRRLQAQTLTLSVAPGTRHAEGFWFRLT